MSSKHPTPIFDSHCHLDYIEAGIMGHAPDTPLNEIITRAHEHGVGYFLNPAVNIADFDRVLGVAERFEHVYASMGVHPCEVTETERVEHWLSDIESRLSHPKVKAIGETGLDYFHESAHTEVADLQRHCFAQQLQMAQRHDLPVIVHDREAHDDVYRLISEHAGVKGVMHCFGGDLAFARRMIELGFYISFAGNVTFKKALDLQETARHIPLEKMLIETDSPFLSPVPERGKPNEPYRTRFVADYIAKLRGISIESVIEASTQNALNLFQIQPMLTK
jgi:TatD DNase family protein